MIIDEILITVQTIFNGMTIDTRAIKRNLDIYAVFSAQEQLLMELSRAGADRQEMHERLRQHANFAWEVVRGGEANPLVELVQSDSHIQQYLSSEAIKRTMQTGQEHLGDAAELATRFAASALEVLRASDPSGEPALPE
jgi:adenylosuccinate lyase